MISRFAVALAMLCITGIAPASAQDLAVEAGIHSGNCDEIGQSMSPLLAPATAIGALLGSGDYEPAANSFSTVDTSLTRLTSEDRVVVVSELGDEVLACGAIGGPLTDAGSLIIGLAPEQDSDVSGVAFLAPSADGAQTNVSLFITGGSVDQMAPAASGQAAQGASEEEAADATQLVATQAPETSAPPTPTVPPIPTETQALGTSSESPAPFFETVTNGGSSVTLLNGYFANAYGYSTPKGGYKYLVIDAIVECAGPDACGYNSMNFSGEDADTGAGYDSVVFVMAEGMLGSDELSPGEYVTGTVLLEVQETASRVIVKYDPKPFDTNDLYWLFQ